MKGKKQVAGISSSERGALITVVTCVSASGIYVPPLMMFPRQNMKTELLEGSLPGTIGAALKSGWIQVDSFKKWFTGSFIASVKPSPADPVVLVLDGHYSHTRNIDVIDLARANGVSIVCLPAQCTHRMQPLDVAFLQPFKTYYAQEIDSWLKPHPGRVVTGN
jgi:hypothetical protein